MIVILPYFLTGGQIEWPTFSPWRFFKILQDSSRFFFKILQDSSRFLNPISAIISSLKPGKRNRLEECPQGMTVRIPRIPPLLPPRPTRRCHIYLSTRFHFRSFHPFFPLSLSLSLISLCRILQATSGASHSRVAKLDKFRSEFLFDFSRIIPIIVEYIIEHGENVILIRRWPP